MVLCLARAKPIILMLLVGCTASEYRQVDVSEFVNYGDTPLSHTIYVGSDEGFHYFVWSSGKAGGRWKIAREQLAFREERPFGEIETFVVSADDGTWQPYLGQGEPLPTPTYASQTPRR